MNNEYILHIDMDGVLTDFDNAFKKLSGGLSPDAYRATHSKKGESSLFLKQGADFWINLDWIEGGKELWDYAVRNFKTVRILSSAGTGKDVEKYKEVNAGKRKWIEDHIPNIERQNIIIVPFANLKAARHSGIGRILVDDKDRTINQWTDKQGIGILHRSSEYRKTIERLNRLAHPETVKHIPFKEIVRSI